MISSYVSSIYFSFEHFQFKCKCIIFLSLLQSCFLWPDLLSGSVYESVCFLPASEAGFSSSTEEEETSGYESEGGRSLSPGALKEPAPSASPSTGRRPRTAFTAEQINSLEKAFKRNAYLGAQDKAELCKRLNLSDKQVWGWHFTIRLHLLSLVNYIS